MWNLAGRAVGPIQVEAVAIEMQAAAHALLPALAFAFVVDSVRPFLLLFHVLPLTAKCHRETGLTGYLWLRGLPHASSELHNDLLKGRVVTSVLHLLRPIGVEF